MSSTLGPTLKRIQIWQQNLNKSRVAQKDLINSDVYKNFDLLVLQELFIDSYGNMNATRDWRVVYPMSFLTCDHPIMSVMLVRESLDTNRWAQLSIPGTSDLMAIQLNAGQGRVTVFGLYVDCHHSTTLNMLDNYLNTHRSVVLAGAADHIFWCGDFNQHHPLWDEDRNKHLFTVGVL